MALPHEGIDATLGGRNFTVPPLTIGQIKRLAESLAAISAAGDNYVQLEGDVVKVIHAALSRNYEDLTLATVQELLDASPPFELAQMVDTIKKVTGFGPKGQANPQTPGS